MSAELELVAGAVAADGAAGPRPARPGAGPKHAALHSECLNCGEGLQGPFCSACGQRADDHHRSVRQLVAEWFEDLTHFDGRLARTVPALFFRPGSLARDHFEGRRQRHVPPLRLFLVSLLLFMLALELVVQGRGSGLTHVTQASPAPGPGVHASSTPAPAPAPTAASPASLAPTPGVAPPSAPEAPRIDPAYVLPPTAGDAADQAVAALAAAQPKNGTEAITALEQSGVGKNPVARWFLERSRAAGVSPQYFTSVMLEWTHRLAVLLLPIFALLLMLCYVYRRRFYVYDHLVVAMQFLSFIFLVTAIAWILPQPGRDVAVVVGTLWTPVNLFMILRGAYGSSVIGAVVKTAFLWVSSLILFAALMLGIVVVALSQMQ